MPEKEQVEKLRTQLESGERGGSDRDRDALLKFSQRVQRMREKYTWHRHLKLLRHCVITSEGIDVDIERDRADVANVSAAARLLGTLGAPAPDTVAGDRRVDLDLVRRRLSADALDRVRSTTVLLVDRRGI